MFFEKICNRTPLILLSVLYLLIVSLIFALSVGFNALTMQQSKFLPQKGQS